MITYLLLSKTMKHVSTVVNNSVSQQALNLSMCKKSGSICMESHFHAVTDDLQGDSVQICCCQ